MDYLDRLQDKDASVLNDFEYLANVFILLLYENDNIILSENDGKLLKLFGRWLDEAKKTP